MEFMAEMKTDTYSQVRSGAGRIGDNNTEVRLTVK